MDNSDKAVEDETAEGIFLIFNPNQKETTVTLPEGSWNICVSEGKAGTTSLGEANGSITVSPVSAVILTKGPAGSGASTGTSTGTKPGINGTVAAGAVALVAAAVAAIAIILTRRKK